MEATRYLIMSGLEEARALPDPDAERHQHNHNDESRSSVTGY